MYFDIGCHLGYWSIKNINNCNKIIAVEASPITFDFLKKNCNNNKITILNYAVCDNNLEDIYFYHAKNNLLLSTINKDWLTNENNRFNNTIFEKCIVKTITLDKLIEIYGEPELIKIDVEGGEYNCIKSLSKKVKLLCFEWASEMNSTTFKILDYLNNIGFSEYYLQFGDEFLFRPDIFYDISNIKQKLNNTKIKKDWGMIWCK